MMSTGLITTEPIDYLVLGHVTQDITPAGLMLGGTVTYAALTAQALGCKAGIVTSARADLDLEPLNGIPVHLIPAEFSTTFKASRHPMEDNNSSITMQKPSQPGISPLPG